jgi:trans-2,3-dihydro-3-hydroxyanthranilate isomerase
MKKHTYYIADVFTNKPFGGNQLAVFPDGKDIDEKYYQKIARELNFSETTFVLPAENNKNDFKLRIFTPYAELPMAGHPTIGTSFVMKETGRINKSQIVIEEGVGDIPVSFQKDVIWMNQPSPIFKNTFKDVNQLAGLLSISADDIGTKVIPQVVSTGVDVLLIGINSIHAIQRIKLNLNFYEKLLNVDKISNIMVYSLETILPDSSVHSRFFSPALGINEDPATGGAAGPLASYLIQYNLKKSGELLQIEQGYEMGRPSQILAIAEKKENSIFSVKVGGESVLVAEGKYYIYS